MPNQPLVSVIIPTLNRREALEKCLISLSRQIYGRFEVVVVDGGSTDGTKELIEEYSERLSITFATQGGGLISQENRAWRLSKGEIVVRTDDDVMVSRRWLEEIVKTFEFSNDVGGVTGPTIIPERLRRHRDVFRFQQKLRGGNILWRLIGKIYFDYFLEGRVFEVGRWFRSGAFSFGSNYPACLTIKGYLEVDHHEACNMAIMKGLLEKVGGFDDSFIGIGEFNEADVSFKIRKLGHRILFNPRAIVYHLPSKSGVFKDRPKSYERILNFITFYFRHIKPNTLDKVFRFFSYLLFLNGFFVYKFIVTGQVDQLGSIPGTIVGLIRNTLSK